MPASRTRKKTQQKKASAARVAQGKNHLAKLAHQLNTDLNAPLPVCTTCKAEREKVSVEQVPADT